MSDETSIEDKTAAVVAARRSRGPNKPKDDGATAAGVAAPVAETKAQPASEPVKTKGRRLFPVKLLRNYHPINDFLIGGKEPSPEQRVKVYAGTEIDMDLEEARDVIGKGIAARNDPIG